MSDYVPRRWPTQAESTAARTAAEETAALFDIPPGDKKEDTG